MTFKLVYYSQQNPQWENDILGFGDPKVVEAFIRLQQASSANKGE